MLTATPSQESLLPVPPRRSPRGSSGTTVLLWFCVHVTESLRWTHSWRSTWQASGPGVWGGGRYNLSGAAGGLGPLTSENSLEHGAPHMVLESDCAF